MKRNSVLLDPTSERASAKRPRLARVSTLDGLTVGLLDISKARGDVFLDRIEERFKEQGVTVKRFAKPTFTRVAPLDLRKPIATQCHVITEALAD